MAKKMIPRILLGIVLIYLLMFIDTNYVVYDVANVMLGTVDKAVTSNLPISRYNHSNMYQQDEYKDAYVKVRITRLFVIHNFFDGYMWVNYTYDTMKNGENIGPSSRHVPSRWKIHREKGKWVIVDIKEDP